MLKTHTGRSN